MSKAFRQGYVENAIELENEKVWNAYLSIDVKQKTGGEKTPVMLAVYLENASQYLGLEDFFKANVDKEVWLTDDVISVEEERDIYAILHAIIGMDVLVHVCVEKNQISKINTLLYNIAKEETDMGFALIKWKYSNDGYMIQLKKRLSRNSECLVRLYEDGNGVVIYDDENDYNIAYFMLENALREQLVSSISRRMDEILAMPVRSGEDDRCWGYDVHLEYNLKWRKSDAKSRLKKHYKFEDVEYSDDEAKIKIAKQLLSVAEVKELWINMSGSYGNK